MITEEIQDRLNAVLDEEAFIERALHFGNRFATEEWGKSKPGVQSSQVSALVAVIAGATRFSEVSSFVRQRVGLGNWPPGLGRDLIEALEEMRNNEVLHGLPQREKLEARLYLARGWAQLIAAEFSFERALHPVEGRDER